MIDEGYVKFDCRWIEGDPPAAEMIVALKRWRDRLHTLGLIGVYPDGIGFGNISERIDEGDRFIITGTGTGGVPSLEPTHVTTVLEVDIARNSLTCAGPVRASSESMTHAAFYRCASWVRAVIHVHHLPTWSAQRNALPTTAESVPYGTPEMAWEIERLWRESDLPERRIVVMGGHQEGIIAVGRDLDEAGGTLLEHIVQP